MEVSPLFLMENPIEMDENWAYPYFRKPPFDPHLYPFMFSSNTWCRWGSLWQCFRAAPHRPVEPQHFGKNQAVTIKKKQILHDTTML